MTTNLPLDGIVESRSYTTRATSTGATIKLGDQVGNDLGPVVELRCVEILRNELGAVGWSAPKSSARCPYGHSHLTVNRANAGAFSVCQDRGVYGAAKQHVEGLQPDRTPTPDRANARHGCADQL